MSGLPISAKRRMQRMQRSTWPGTLGGELRSAELDRGVEAAIIADSMADSGNTASADLWVLDQKVLTAAGAQTWQLSYVPMDESVQLRLNGLALDEGSTADYTIDWTTGLVTILTPALTIGDTLSARYQTKGDANITTQETFIVPGAVSDTFDRPDSPTTLNPASDGGSWAIDFGGVFGVTGNTAYNVSAVVGMGPSSGPSVAIARRDVGQAPMEVIIDVTRSSTAGGSVIVACYDPVTTYCYEVFYDSSSSVGSLSRIASDGHPGLGVFLAFTAWTGSTTSLKLRRDSAGVVTAYQLVAGVWISKGTFTDTFPLPGTWAGFGTAPTSPGVDHWDNFLAVPL